MGVDVVLMQVHQPGTSPKRRQRQQVDVVLDGADTFARLCEKSQKPMLGRVDPYGTLTLTVEDMPQFISELESLRESVGVASHKSLLESICHLARRCLDDPTLEISLEGD
ncbi:hypothetical protein [Streptomyces sp. SYSU K217416]